MGKWKGFVTGYLIRVVEASSGAMCGYGFEPGREYLVSTRRSAEGALSATLCSRTKPLEAAGEEVAKLESGRG